MIAVRTFLTVIALAVAQTAFAQDAGPSAEGAPDVDEPLVIEDGGFVIRGKVQKPEVVVFITRDAVEQDFDLDLKKEFLQRVVDALEDAPF